MVLAVAWWLTEYTETNILRHELDCQFVRQDESVRLGSQTVKSQGIICCRRRGAILGCCVYPPDPSRRSNRHENKRKTHKRHRNPKSCQ